MLSKICHVKRADGCMGRRSGGTMLKNIRLFVNLRRERRSKAVSQWRHSSPETRGQSIKTRPNKRQKAYEIVALPITVRVVRFLKRHEGEDARDEGISYSVWRIFDV